MVAATSTGLTIALYLIPITNVRFNRQDSKNIQAITKILSRESSINNVYILFTQIDRLNKMEQENAIKEWTENVFTKI